ncbi:ribosome small subunit-dependent GTPase A [Thermodesulfobacteriota bacterium]
MKLEDLGWNNFFQQHFETYHKHDLIPARVVQEHKNIYFVLSETDELTAKVTGKMHYNAQGYSDYPAVGDWVAIKALPGEGSGTIQAILPRQTKFSRKAVLSGGMPETGGKVEEQIIAANIDTVFLVSGLDNDFNLRRIERYAAVAWDSGAVPVVVLNKIDLCNNIDSVIQEVETTIFGISVLPVSAANNEGLDNFSRYLDKGKTVTFLGSSGVGKSTIINRLIGYDHFKTNAVREHDHKGRHTTTHREMILLPTGGLIIDTPGMREIQVWNADEGISRTFEDIEKLAEKCRFNNCQHANEPGCVVQQAIEKGDLDTKRFQNFLKLQRELQHLEDRQMQKGRQSTKVQWEKEIAKFSRQMKKNNHKA